MSSKRKFLKSTLATFLIHAFFKNNKIKFLSKFKNRINNFIRHKNKIWILGKNDR
tara:strand:+ start:1219 stop:1383 length:165 start_codon:yes stop_codon:yes gene_type:complete